MIQPPREGRLFVVVATAAMHQAPLVTNDRALGRRRPSPGRVLVLSDFV
ncbi:MAG: hypothetical protein ACRD2J_16200 [Thermoanaerobaculia bacterium]